MIELVNTKDILKFIGENKTESQFICGFSMETENLIENSQKKLAKKNLDMVVANNLRDEGAGFKHNTNVITIITKDNVTSYDLMTKSQVAHEILNEINALRKDK